MTADEYAERQLGRIIDEKVDIERDLAAALARVAELEQENRRLRDAWPDEGDNGVDQCFDGTWVVNRLNTPRNPANRTFATRDAAIDAAAGLAPAEGE